MANFSCIQSEMGSLNLKIRLFIFKKNGFTDSQMWKMIFVRTYIYIYTLLKTNFSNNIFQKK